MLGERYRPVMVKTMSTQPSEIKADLRRELLLKRRSMDREAWLRKSGDILRRAEAMPEIRNAGKIHCYVSMEQEREVFTHKLLERLCLERKEVYMPYIDRGSMVVARYTIGQRFMASGLGPPVPDPLILADYADFDAVIVPLVGFDSRGGRLGFGKGWYDRLFSSLSRQGIHPVRIGLAFDFQMIPSVPAEQWDELLDMVVTEYEIVKCLTSRA
jgi:5-formyltetrahydrofolate cyclo-ligase